VFGKYVFDALTCQSARGSASPVGALGTHSSLTQLPFAQVSAHEEPPAIPPLPPKPALGPPALPPAPLEPEVPAAVSLLEPAVPPIAEPATGEPAVPASPAELADPPLGTPPLEAPASVGAPLAPARGAGQAALPVSQTFPV
jgi:hypothetical protein